MTTSRLFALALSAAVALSACRDTSSSRRLPQAEVEPGEQLKLPRVKGTSSAQGTLEALSTVCARGLAYGCIDQAYVRARDQSGDEATSQTALENYCEQGYGSACYYLALLLGEGAYLSKACSLAEWRGCPRGVRRRYDKPPQSHCEVKQKFPSTQANPEPDGAKSKVFKSEEAANMSARIDAQVPWLQYCYERKLHSLSSQFSPDLQGWVRLLFKLDRHTGKVTDMVVDCDDFYDKEISRCVGDVVSMIEFDLMQPNAGVDNVFTVRKTFHFSSGL